MGDWESARYRDHKWIVRDPQLLGGKLAVRGTRLSRLRSCWPVSRRG